jgi:hypothetical protein
LAKPGAADAYQERFGQEKAHAGVAAAGEAWHVPHHRILPATSPFQPTLRRAMSPHVRSAAELSALLTLEEQVLILSGEDFWSLPAIARLGIGKLRVTDGPNGARGGGSLIGGVKSAAFPVGIAIGASWNVALAQEIGAALARTFRCRQRSMFSAPSPMGETSNAIPKTPC